MAFKFLCPKCNGNDFNIVRDNRTFTPTRAFELIFSCRCGRQLFGDQIEQEYERQKRAYEAEAGERERAERARIQREKAEVERQAAMRKAMLYQQRYREEQRRKADAQEAERKAEQDRRWREKVDALRESDPTAELPEREPLPPVAPVDEVDLPEPPPAPPEAELAEGGPGVGLPEGHPMRCAWATCANERRKNSKYCSRNCSNKNARARHKKRSGKKRKSKSAAA